MTLMKKKITIILLLILSSLMLIAQDKGNFLSQKMDLENSIKDRISKAIESVLGHDSFIVDVKADVEFQADRKIEEVYKPSQQSMRFRKSSGRKSSSSYTSGSNLLDNNSGNNLSAEDQRVLKEILPGIPSEMPANDIELLEGNIMSDMVEDTTVIEGAPVEEIIELPGMKSPEMDIQDESEDILYSRSVSHIQTSVPRIRRIDISIILQEGISPDLVESVRQVAMIAAHFDRKRGDILSIMTAAFGSKKAMAAETSDMGMPFAKYAPSSEEQAQNEETKRMISDIQEKLDALSRDKQINAAMKNPAEPTATENMLMKIIDKLTTNKSFEEDLEEERLISEQKTRLEMLAKDTSNLRKLQDEIAGLKLQIAMQQSGDNTFAESQQKLNQKKQLEESIAEKISLLNSTQAELAEIQQQKIPWWVWLILGLLLLAVFILVWVVMSKGKAAVPIETSAPVRDNYPDEKAMRKRIISDLKSTLEKESVVLKTTKADMPPIKDDEMNEIRSNIVNLSVANPDAAASLMKKWVNDVDEAESSEEGEASNE